MYLVISIVYEILDWMVQFKIAMKFTKCHGNLSSSPSKQKPYSTMSTPRIKAEETDIAQFGEL